MMEGCILLQVISLAVFWIESASRGAGKAHGREGQAVSLIPARWCTILTQSTRRRAARAALDVNCASGCLATRPPRSVSLFLGRRRKEPSLAPGGFLRRYGRLGEPP